MHEILTGAGATAVWVTHDVDDALALATRTIVLARTPDFVRPVEPAAGIEVGVRHALLAALGVSAEIPRATGRHNRDNSPTSVPHGREA